MKKSRLIFGEVTDKSIVSCFFSLTHSVVLGVYVIIINRSTGSGYPLTSDDANTMRSAVVNMCSAAATCGCDLGPDTCGLVNITAVKPRDIFTKNIVLHQFSC